MPASKAAPQEPAPMPTQEVVTGGRRRGRLGLLQVPAALLLLMLVAGLGYLAFRTPSGDDLQGRIDALAGGQPLRPSDVPLVLAQAVVAVEDERFYQHHGLDTIGTTRAVWDDVTGLCACEGGSTITQQLAKTVYYPDSDRVTRKLPGMAVALKIELHNSKQQIMADYLSVERMGYGLVGARAAACAYFDVQLFDLTVAQAAELAGSLQAPSLYDPRSDPDLARARRDHVLDRMVEAGYLDLARAKAASSEPVLTGDAAHSPGC